MEWNVLEKEYDAEGEIGKMLNRSLLQFVD